VVQGIGPEFKPQYNNNNNIYNNNSLILLAPWKQSQHCLTHSGLTRIPSLSLFVVEDIEAQRL
jgi:hypothetical protein